MEKLFSYEDRLVRFVGEIILFLDSIPQTYAFNIMPNN